MLQVGTSPPPPPSASPQAPAPEQSQPQPETLPSLRLDDAVQIALRHQPAVIQARAATRSASARADQARSGLFPQVSASAVYQHAYGTLGGRATTTTTGGAVAPIVPSAGTYDFFSVGANASQLIWDFGQTYERTRAADRATDAFRQSERTSELTVAFSVRRAFFQARAEKALIKVAEETLANLQKHLSQIQGFVSVGTRPEIDLAQARSDIATERVALINAQNGYDIAKAQLAVAMGTPGTAFDVPDEELPTLDVEDKDVDQLTRVAIQGRPELTSLERTRDSQELTVRGLKGGYGPTLSAIAGASESGLGLGSLTPGWNVGAQLVWPIFQGGLTTGLVHEAEGNLDVTVAQIEGEKLQVRLDVESAVLTLRAAKSALAAANDALVNSREQLRLAEGRYTSGVGSIIELGDAQVAAANSAAQVVQAQFNLSTARAQLLMAMGRR